MKLKLLAVSLLLPIIAMAGVISGGAITSTRKATFNKGYLTPFWITVTNPVAAPKITGTTTTTADYRDRTYATTTNSVGNDFLWNYTYELDRKNIRPIVRTSSNNSVITPDSSNSNRWLYVANGTATLTLSHDLGQTVTTTVNTAVTTSPLRVFSTFRTNSVGLESATRIDGLLSGKTVSTARPLYSTWSPPSSFTRNSNAWCASIDMSCIPSWNSYCNVQGVLITPRHIMFAMHYGMPVGTTFKFTSMSNTTYTRTVSSVQQAYGDLGVAKLDSDLPSDIKPAKVLPSTWNSKLALPTTDSEAAANPDFMPVININQDLYALIAEVATVYLPTDTTNPSVAGWIGNNMPSGTRAQWGMQLRGGDSGNPSFFVVNGELALSTVWTAAGQGGGTGQFVSGRITEVNTALTSLGGGYSLTIIDLSGFTTY